MKKKTGRSIVRCADGWRIQSAEKMALRSNVFKNRKDAERVLDSYEFKPSETFPKYPMIKDIKSCELFHKCCLCAGRNIDRDAQQRISVWFSEKKRATIFICYRDNHSLSIEIAKFINPDFANLDKS